MYSNHSNIAFTSRTACSMFTSALKPGAVLEWLLLFKLIQSTILCWLTFVFYALFTAIDTMNWNSYSLPSAHLSSTLWFSGDFKLLWLWQIRLHAPHKAIQLKSKIIRRELRNNAFIIEWLGFHISFGIFYKHSREIFLFVLNRVHTKNLQISR